MSPYQRVCGQLSRTPTRHAGAYTGSPAGSRHSDGHRCRFPVPALRPPAIPAQRLPRYLRDRERQPLGSATWALARFRPQSRRADAPYPGGFLDAAPAPAPFAAVSDAFTAVSDAFAAVSDAFAAVSDVFDAVSDVLAASSEARAAVSLPLAAVSDDFAATSEALAPFSDCFAFASAVFALASDAFALPSEAAAFVAEVAERSAASRATLRLASNFSAASNAI